MSFYEEAARYSFLLSERGTSVASNHSQMCWCSATHEEERQGLSRFVGRQWRWEEAGELELELHLQVPLMVSHTHTQKTHKPR